MWNQHNMWCESLCVSVLAGLCDDSDDHASKLHGEKQK